jgi:uncharacterized protein (TIGR02646 family)
MIYVPRGPSPTSLDGPESPGGIEAGKATEHFENPGTRLRKFRFQAYGRKDVRAALAQMFDLKCAYCESVYAANAPMIVEHYRPKGGFDLPNGKRQIPGYWWLGSTWTNLLPSCWDCNSERGHDYEGTRRVTGKANRFPLNDERRRATTPGQEHHEDPRLLDPTVDDPDEHLEFVEKGVIKPREQEGEKDRRGDETIEVLGLRRPNLVRVRRDHLKNVEGAIKRYRKALRRVDRNELEADEDLGEASDELKEYMEPGAAYAGMARQHIRRELANLGVPLP